MRAVIEIKEKLQSLQKQRILSTSSIKLLDNLLSILI